MIRDTQNSSGETEGRQVQTRKGDVLATTVNVFLAVDSSPGWQTRDELRTEFLLAVETLSSAPETIALRILSF
jgi:hypothetical protein